MKDKTARLAAVLVVIASLGAYFLSSWFLLLSLFIGVNMFQSTYTKWCPAEKILKFE
ncbi:MAG: DUF2892 domain-containing protein [Nanoarchaeota archaeon]|nr:DUF2892 domain-containing protein [Nanoarchaeota archaeon]